MKKNVAFSIICLGFTAMVSQIVFMREFLIAYYGNELSIGFILANWLVCTAFGSWLGGAVIDKVRIKEGLFSLLQMGLSGLLLLSILAVRYLRPLLEAVPGESASFFVIAVSSLFILTSLCACFGFMFSLACRTAAVKSRTLAAKIGTAYALEAIGSSVGGLVASFLLVRFLSSVAIVGLLIFLNLLAAFSLAATSREKPFKPFLTTLAFILFVAAVSVWLFNGWELINRYTLRKQWQGHQLLTVRNSIYGSIAVTKRGSQTSFFNNGAHLYTVPDELVCEEAVHFPLLEHPAPQKVLLIGGGVGGMLKEVLKEPVKKVDYVELDPVMVKLAEDYLSKELGDSLKDPRVSIINTDARFYINTTSERYDCVIIHMGDPYCAQINRFYTMEFFKAVKGVLKKQGIVSFALSSSESYINSQLRDFLASIHAAVKGVFRDVKVFPGDKAYFLACDEEGLLTYDYRILTQRADARRLDVRYVREYYLFARLSRYNVSYIKNILDVKRPVVTNRDFQPASYLYATVFWASRFKDSLFIKMFKFTNRRNLWLAVFIFCGGIFILALTGMPGLGRSYKQVASTAIMATGFSQMAFQVLVLLLFQIIWGYLYYKLGFILTSFMIGLAIAGLYMVRVMPRIKNAMAVLALLQSAVCVYFLMLPPLSYWLAGTRVYFVGWLGSNLVFPFLSMLAGIIGGLQFPLANYIYLGKGRKAGRAGGITYGIDLMGSCLGALLTSAFLIPVLGITNTCLAISLINAAVAYLLIKMS